MHYCFSWLSDLVHVSFQEHPNAREPYQRLHQYLDMKGRNKQSLD